MRRVFEKSICKCPRCVAKRRIRFLTVLGICIAMAAGCYVLVDHSKPGVPPSSNAQEAPAEEPTLDANAIPEAKSEPLSVAATQPGTSWKQQGTKTAQEPIVAKDGLSADSPERTENLTPSRRQPKPGRPSLVQSNRSSADAAYQRMADCAAG